MGGHPPPLASSSWQAKPPPHSPKPVEQKSVWSASACVWLPHDRPSVPPRRSGFMDLMSHVPQKHCFSPLALVLLCPGAMVACWGCILSLVWVQNLNSYSWPPLDVRWSSLQFLTFLPSVF